MSLVANLLPDVTRPDVGLVLASGWIVGTHVHRLVVAPWQHRHRLTAIAAADPWERLAATARGLLRNRWALVDLGWRLPGDALLAAAARTNAQRNRQTETARDALDLAA